MQKILHPYLLLVLAFWLLSFSAYTQTYPVTISTQITQPSPIYLSNYANTSTINSPIKVQLILNDLTIMNRQVRLKCYFQGAVSFVTNDFVVGAAPMYLEGGFPAVLTNVELGPYFEFRNIKGVTPYDYAQPLPEGIYTISFEVYDFATNKKLSKKSSVTTTIFQNQPPILNLPANNAAIVEQNIQNIIFSWTPQNSNISNVEYEFSLVEIWNTNTPIQNAFAYSPPLYTINTRNTIVQYSIAEPQLIPGKTYAWRVKAKALIGAEEIGVFKNNGYSEIFSFKYLTTCNPPMAITTTSVSQEQAKITWSGAIDNYDYQVNYREKNADSKWYKAITPRENITISNLKAKTTYEYTVGAACDPGEYTHSNIQEFTTMAQDEIAFVGCGIKPDPLALSNKTPLPALFPNDVVTAGDFPIVVLKSTGSNGNFSGEGYVTLPFLAKFRELIDAASALAGKNDDGDSKMNIGKYTRIRITFKNIGVNTDFQLISGEIIASYDKNWGGMIDGDKLYNDVMGDNGKVIALEVGFEIASVVKNPDGTLTITGTNGAVNIQPKTDNDVIITDRNGKQYAVSPNTPAGNIASSGKVAPGGIPTPQNTNGMGSGGNIKEISSPDVTITFAAGTGFYSFDENPNQNTSLAKNTKLNSTYEIIPKKDGSKYYVHYKVISDAPNAEDVITAKATFSNGKTTADIVFKTENGTEIPSTWSGNIATLKLKRTLDFAKESVLATVKAPVQNDSVKVTTKQDIAGTLNMWHMISKKVNVTLVSINGASLPKDPQDELNKIYNQVGIEFNINTTSKTLNNTWGTSIETGNSDLLNTYTDEQQSITQALITELGSEYNANTYYMLYTNESASNGNSGFMPLKHQFGFVFDGANRTLAHELGHGVFGLRHPSTTYNIPDKSGFLMDKDDSSTGILFTHNDWEIMHAPGLQLYQFTQGSSDGALAGGYGLTPDWHFVRTNESTVLSGSQVPIVGEGMLGGFESTENNITVNYIWNVKSNTYKIDGTGTDYDKANYKDVLDDKVVVWLIYRNNQDCSKRKYIRTYYSQIKTDLPKHDLTTYIEKIDKIAKADKLEIFSNTLGCVGNDTSGNNSGSENYTNYVVNLAKDANKKYTEDKTEVSTQEAHLFDLATVISDKEKQKILSQFGGIKQSTGILTKIYLVDSKTPEAKKTEINNYLSSLKGKEIGLLIDFTNVENPSMKTFLGDGIEGKGIPSMNNYIQYLTDVLPKFEGKYTPFNPLTAMLDGLAGVIGQAKIPVRFYNPDETDYNPIPAQVYSYATLTVLNDQLVKIATNKNPYTEKFSPSRADFAFTCGIWNGFIGALGGIPEGASMVIKLITNEDKTRSKTLEAFSKFEWQTIQTLAGDQWNKYTANPCMVSYGTGEVGFIVISCFYGAGEAKGLATFFQSLDRLDAVGALMSKISKIAGKVLMPVLNKSGKAFKFVLHETAEFLRDTRIVIKPSPNLYCGFPIANIKLIKKGVKFTEAEIEKLESKIDDAIKAEGGIDKLPLDENGNRIIEIDIDGEKTPVVLGNEESLDKIKAEPEPSDAIKKNKLIVTDPFDEAGKLKPDVRYKAGEFDYWGETDELGRLESMSATDLRLTEREKRLIHDGKTPGKDLGDHAGHLIADRFGGSKEIDNIVSQLSKVNLSEYKIIENEWARALSAVPPLKVEVNIKIIYEGTDLRPSGFEVKYKIGTKIKTVEISNIK